jgi:uncharacterized LabA/DUF88 family protein
MMEMKTEQKQERTMAFVDIRNILGCRDAIGRRYEVDFATIFEHVVGNRTCVATYAFEGKNESGRKLHDTLRSMGVNVITRDGYDAENRQQKEVDVAIASELLEQALMDNFDTAILISGDRDFLPAIEKVQNRGKKVEIAAFTESTSRIMQTSCDVFHNLDPLPVIYMTCEAPVTLNRGQIQSATATKEVGYHASQ